ncbi:hypothetical protein FRC00_007857 [Tulasnella sp. 408]|nr:hypothetical protein FRC00_007857 [Tulasnella sp. 408]
MRPKFGTHEYCGRTCAEEAKRKAGGGGLLGSLTSSFWSGGAGDDDGTGRSSSQYPGRSTGSDKHANRRFQERWDDPILALPEITAIFQINVAKKYMNRFKDAVNAAERLGGSTTKSAFYGGQCICDLGVPQFGTDELCTWGSCSICIVIRKCFDFLEFKLPHHTGDLGNGIYANLNPAKANRFTVQKANYEIRAMILCSIIHLNDLVQGDKNKHSAFIEDTGRVFCANKDVILPRQLILYKDPKPKAGLQPSRAGPGYPFLR